MDKMQKADEKTNRRMIRRIKHRYFAVNRIHRVFEDGVIKTVSESGAPILEDEFEMLKTFTDEDCEVILKSRPLRQFKDSKKEIGDDIVTEKGEGIVPILKEEFKDFTPSGKAWDCVKSINMFARDIKAIINDAKSDRVAILTGNKGKFVWIQYHDPNDSLGDGGVASGSIEDAPIHHNGLFFNDINYSKIAFAFIPVDDF